MGWFSQSRQRSNVPASARTSGGTAAPATAESAGAPSGGGGSSTGQEDAQQVFMELMQGKPINLETLRAIEGELRRRTGASFTMNARGTAADLKLPSGELVDVVGGFDGPEGSRRLQWLQEDPAFGGGGGGRGGLPPGYSMDSPNGLSSFNAPGLIAPWLQQFQKPDPNSISADPSFQFQLKRGLEAVQNSAAGKGTLLTGGTLKDLTEFGQGLASTFDDKYWNRAFQQYGMDRDTFWGNQDNAFGKLQGAGAMGMNASSSWAPGTAGLQTGAATAQANTATAKNNSLNDLFGNLAEMGMAAYRRRRAPTAAGEVI